ncbi:MAG: DNA polymerase III subunit gamma/tau [Tannerellaceae bacterium]|jgi:DNA polymerase-3 subunit gamma/tau|nr:DNA polymerase III subunit gamma/tau [Tannerellaceae bacterium]
MNNYIVSARKYRPSTFRSVVGQKSLTTTLKNAITHHKLAHAYLFCGPRGVGKTSCARIFAKTINCLDLKAQGEPCNTCESCQAFNEQRSYNIHELDAASNNSVDDIRSLIEQVRIPPAIGKYKVFIIDEVHMLSSQAFNAFLKTLEEPPHHVIFILATTEKHKVLPTILSRCQIYDFSRISVADMVEHLEYVAEQEGVKAEAEALGVIAQKADGGMRDALSIFDQVVSFSGGDITYRAVIDNLNVLDCEYYFRLTDTMLESNVSRAMLILNELLSKGFDGQNIITGLSSHFRDLLVCKDEATLVLLETGASIRERYKETARRCPDKFLFKAIEIANTCDLNYRVSRNKRLLLELTLIQLCQLTGPDPGDSKKKLPIEPIDRPGKQPQAAPVAATKQSPPTVAETTAEPPRHTTQPLMSTSIRNLGKEEKETAKPTAVSDVKEQQTPFSEAELTTVWEEYAQSIEKNEYLKNTMINCKPILQENYLFEVIVHNPGQEDELRNESVKFLPYLQSHLRNIQVDMKIRISETNEKKLAYTTSEKYEYLRKQNPLLNRLTSEFNLQPD